MGALLFAAAAVVVVLLPPVMLSHFELPIGFYSLQLSDFAVALGPSISSAASHSRCAAASARGSE